MVLCDRMNLNVCKWRFSLPITLYSQVSLDPFISSPGHYMMLQRPLRSLSCLLIGHSVNFFPFILGFWESSTSLSTTGVMMASLSNSVSSVSPPGVVTAESILSTGFIALLIFTLIST